MVGSLITNHLFELVERGQVRALHNKEEVVLNKLEAHNQGWDPVPFLPLLLLH